MQVMSERDLERKQSSFPGRSKSIIQTSKIFGKGTQDQEYDSFGLSESFGEDSIEIKRGQGPSFKKFSV